MIQVSILMRLNGSGEGGEEERELGEVGEGRRVKSDVAYPDGSLPYT